MNQLSYFIFVIHSLFLKVGWCKITTLKTFCISKTPTAIFLSAEPSSMLFSHLCHPYVTCLLCWYIALSQYANSTSKSDANLRLSLSAFCFNASLSCFNLLLHTAMALTGGCFWLCFKQQKNYQLYSANLYKILSSYPPHQSCSVTYKFLQISFMLSFLFP